MFVIFLFFSVFSVDSFMVGLENCNLSDAAFLNCFKTLFDKNNDNVVSYEEVVDGLVSRVTYTAGLTAEFIMRADLNHDNALDEANDWNHVNRTFYKDDVTKRMACFACRQNGIPMNN
jgi:hypothetical protein